jgi:outer membrane immunogenic protein
MNKILKLSAVALLASSTSLMAQSKSFEGVSLGLSASVVGAEVSGSSASSSPGTRSSSGSIGKVAEIAAIDFSYGYPVNNNFLVAIGASYTPGKAKAGTGTYTGDGTSGDTNGRLNLEIKDPYTIYIAPTYAVSKDAALYAKLGYSKADVNVTATDSAALSKKPNDLEGITYAIGSKILLNNNVYIGVEASLTEYDSISATRTTGSVNVNADATVAQGTITLGYKF